MYCLEFSPKISYQSFKCLPYLQWLPPDHSTMKVLPSLERILKFSHLANQDSSYRIPGDSKHLPFLNNGGHCAPRNTLQKWFSDRSYTGYHWLKRINQTRLVDMMCWWNLCQTEFELFSHWMLRLEMNVSLILLSLMKNRGVILVFSLRQKSHIQYLHTANIPSVLVGLKSGRKCITMSD